MIHDNTKLVNKACFNYRNLKIENHMNKLEMCQ